LASPAKVLGICAATYCRADAGITIDVRFWVIGGNSNNFVKQKDRLAAVSPKFNLLIRSGGGERGLPFPTPAKQTQRAKAGAKQW
jgi:hypothetical protein